MMSRTAKTQIFRQLHQPGQPFILANAWDAGSAKMLTALGASAIATTSAGHAFTLGRSDMGHISREESLAHAADLVAATNLPVSGDFENGYGPTAQHVAETIRLAAQVGLAGCSIEDTQLPDTTPYEFDEAVERVSAGVAAARAVDGDFVLTARADGFMNGHYDEAEALRRLQAFEAAGADVLYAPGLPDIESLARICAALQTPVNVLAAGKFCQYSTAQFASAGAARISLGSALARMTHQVILRQSDLLFNSGDFTELSGGASGATIDPLMYDN
jgi:2-methylisocitrate lyase-like PEP mutase family enzyme